MPDKYFTTHSILPRGDRAVLTLFAELPSEKLADQIVQQVETLIETEVNKFEAAKPHVFQSPLAMGSCEVPGCGKSEDRPPHVEAADGIVSAVMESIGHGRGRS